MKLNSKRYEEIVEIVNDLIFSENIDYPIDCIGLIKRFNIELKKYSSFNFDDVEFFIQNISSDGFSILTEDKYIIYYNDQSYEERIRWTLMHEFGHYYLKHSEQSDLAEAEANYFAKYILAPPFLVHYYGIKNNFELAEKFKLSYEASNNSWNFYCNWNRIRNGNYNNEEKLIIKLL